MRVRVMRQVHFSTADQRSIDLVFFVNGLPVATVELKTDFTQSLDEAIKQYRKDRNPLTNGRPEPLLSFGHRALVHFAVSNDLAAMTTRLEGEKTHFLPFNTGHDDGAGNPPGADGRSATAYLWERVWEKRRLAQHHRPADDRGDQGGVGRRDRHVGASHEHAVPAVPPVGGRHEHRGRGRRGGCRAALPDRALGWLGEDEHDRLDGAPAGPAARRATRRSSTRSSWSSTAPCSTGSSRTRSGRSTASGKIVATISPEDVRKAGGEVEVRAAGRAR